MKIFIALVLLTMATLSPALAQTSAPKNDTLLYPDRILEWRKNREEGLKKEGGWLSVAGLHWLNEGDNTVGAAASSDYVLPAGSAPDTVGVIILRGEKAILKVAPGATVTVNGKPLPTEAELKTDAGGVADKVKIGQLTFTVIQRGKRIGIRLWDNNAPARKGFTGLKWYPVEEAYRITAKFVPYDPPKKVRVATILGGAEDGISPGYVTFTLNKQECRLETQGEGNQLFINFKDLTSGDATYPPGRFLYAAKPENGQVILDFNQAYNPPCAFTAFATCPLPPAQNRLNVRITAGEKRYHLEEDFVPAGQTINYADAIAAYVKADKENPPKKGSILFIGASIFRQWTHLTEQLAPLPAFNRGFGGARTWEVLHYAEDIALPYEPKIIVYYCGANDINAGEKPEAILERYRQFSDKVTERLPDTKLYFLAVFRAPQKKDKWDIVDATNRLIRDYSLKTKNRVFLDANPLAFNKRGQPRAELYQADGLHFTDAAYVELAAFVKPTLQEAWRAQTATAERE